MWHSTEKMAAAIAAGLHEGGMAVRPMSLKKWHRSDVMTEVLDAAVVAVGSPTLNNGLFPTVADFLTYMKGLKPQNKIGAGFGSYGWSGESVAQIMDVLESAGFALPEKGSKLQYVPEAEALMQCFEFGRRLAEHAGANR
jgi:flavorubredoxin